MTFVSIRRSFLNAADETLGVSSTTPYKRKRDSGDSDEMVICYWCRTPITGRVSEWRGEPVHAGCPE